MGIFDVFSNSKSSAQGDDSQNTQASTSMSDVQYPIPAANSTQATATQSDQDVSDQFSQFASNYNPQNDPLDLTTFDNAVQGKTTQDLSAVNSQIEPIKPIEPVQPIEPVTQQADAPVEGNPFSAQVLNSQQTEVSNQAADIAAPADNLTENPQEATSALESAMQNLQSPEGVKQPTPESAPTNYDYSTLVADEQNTEAPAQTPVVEPTISEVKPEEPVEEEKPDVTKIEFGVSPTVAPQNSTPIDETPLTPEFKPEESIQERQVNETIVDGKQFENPDGSFGDISEETTSETLTQESSLPDFSKDVSNLEVGEGKQFENPDGSFGNVEVEPQSETQVKEVQPEVKPQEPAPLAVTNNYEPEDTSMIGKINLQNIKRLGFIGLNAKTLNEGIKMDLQEVSEAIGGMLEEYILDSSIGYAPELLKGLNNKDLNIKSFQLKSAYSLFTQEPFNLNEYSNLTSYIFSDSLERLKNIIGSSDALVLVYSEGMNNLMSSFTVMNMANFYKEIGKPFVLLGNEWETMLNSLVSSGVLDQSLLTSVLVASDSNELLAHLQTLDNNFKKISTTDPKSRIVDLRKEDDELIYIK